MSSKLKCMQRARRSAGAEDSRRQCVGGSVDRVARQTRHLGDDSPLHHREHGCHLEGRIRRVQRSCQPVADDRNRLGPCKVLIEETGVCRVHRAVDDRLTCSDQRVGSDCLLIGVDLRKDVETLHAAYNDSAGVTAAFNLNLLHRINREIGGDFDIDSFAHDARWVPEFGRIEMHLVSVCAQTVSIGGESFEFKSGESIHTEDSRKYDVEGFKDLAREAGWNSIDCWTDPDDLFSIHLLRVA